MGKTAILAIRIIGDATAATTALEKVDGSAKSMQASMDKAAIGAGLALGALAAAAVSAGNAASELEQATGAVDSVFGSYAAKVHEYAATAANDVGLSKEAYSQMSAVLGSQLKNMGVDMDEVSGKSNALIGVGADLAATFGGTTSDAVNAVSSLLRGERDPIERYGVSLKQVDIDAKKAALGLDSLTGEADKAATTQATLALLTEQTASAQGQFGREADTAAGMQQRATAAWTDAQAALGEQLLPVMTDAAGIAADMAKWMGENSDVVTILALVIAGLAAGIIIASGAMKVFAAAQAIQTVAQWASNSAWLASPVTWIVLAIILAIGILVAIILLAIKYQDEIAVVAAAAWAAIIGWVEKAYQWLVEKIIGAILAVVGFFVGLGDSVAGAFSTVVDWIRDAYDWLMKLVGNAIPGWVKDMLGMGGSTFTARLVTDPDPPTSSRMAFSGPETMAGFGYRMGGSPQPSTMATIPNLSSLSSGDQPPPQIVNNIYNTTVNGAIDKAGTARSVTQAINGQARTTGTTTTAGRSL